jgi:hypothetical protein
MDPFDHFGILCDFAEKHGTKPELFPIDDKAGWEIVILEKSGLHSGRAKGRSINEAALNLCEKLKLVKI